MAGDPSGSPEGRVVSLAKELTPEAWAGTPGTGVVRHVLLGGVPGKCLRRLSCGIGVYDTAVKYLFLFVIACGGLASLCFSNLIFRSDGSTLFDKYVKRR